MHAWKQEGEQAFFAAPRMPQLQGQQLKDHSVRMHGVARRVEYLRAEQGRPGFFGRMDSQQAIGHSTLF